MGQSPKKKDKPSEKASTSKKKKPSKQNQSDTTCDQTNEHPDSRGNDKKSKKQPKERKPVVKTKQ